MGGKGKPEDDAQDDTLIVGDDDNEFTLGKDKRLFNSGDKQISFFDGAKTTKNYFDDYAILDGSKKGATLQSATKVMISSSVAQAQTLSATKIRAATNLSSTMRRTIP